MRILLTTLLALLSFNSTFSAPKTPEPWSLDQLPTWDAGVRGGIPSIDSKITIKASTLAKEKKPAAYIQKIIDDAKAPTVIQLPKGTYELDAPLSMKSGIVLRGDGVDRTLLRFNIALPDTVFEFERPAHGSIRFEGKASSEAFQLANDHLKGATEIQTTNTNAFSIGDMIEIFSENDPGLMYTDPRWNKRYGDQALGQIVSIIAITPESIGIDTPLRLDYYTELNPRIRKIEPIENAGLENLSLERLDDEIDSIVGFQEALNCWVLNCNSFMATRGHIWINHSRYITVQGNEVHHSYGYGGGGNGYGIVAGNIAVDCLFVDNIAHNLRHSYMAKKGSNGNVFAFNYSHTRRRDPEGEPLLCDLSLHGHYPYQNLFEGNVVEYIDIADHWGPIGPDTTFFRNRVQTQVKIRDHSHYMRLIGNVIREKGIYPDVTVHHTSLLENILLSSPENEQPKHTEDLPTSLYFQSKPDFWGDFPWPSIGPGADNSQEIAIPAQRRWQASQRDDVDC